MFFVLGFIPGYVLSWILKQVGLLRIPREVELAGLDHVMHATAVREDDEMRAVLEQEARRPAPGRVGRRLSGTRRIIPNGDNHHDRKLHQLGRQHRRHRPDLSLRRMGDA